jgi:hypothetical protein
VSRMGLHPLVLKWPDAAIEGYVKALRTAGKIRPDILPSLVAYCKRCGNPGKISEILASLCCASTVVMKMEAMWAEGLGELKEAIDLAGLGS